MELLSTRDAVEGEMVRGLLESAGIPSMLRPAGIDWNRVATSILGGPGRPQRVMVHAGRLEEARAVIADTLVAEDEDEG